MNSAKVILSQTNNHVLLLTLTCLLATSAAAQVNYAFSGNTAYVTSSPFASGNIVIASTYIGYPVTSIGDDAFSSCTSLTSVTIPNSVTNIGNSAFNSCFSLTSVTIPNSVTSIGSWAFNSCISLTNFSVGAANSFYSSLDGVLLNKAQTTLIQFPGGRGDTYAVPNSVTNIGDGAFGGCEDLTSVTIPNSVASIGSWAFADCYGLASVTIPNSVTSIGSWAFADCYSLTNFSVSAANSVYSSLDGVMFDKAQTTLTQFPGGRGGNYAVPNSVTNIGNSAFYSCYSLTSVTIPNSVTSIGDFAFYICSSLTNLTFLGNAPSLNGSYYFSNVGAGAKVYYYDGTTGWGPTYGGLPTVMLGAPAPQVGAGSAGVKLGGFGFTLNGVVNQTIVVEASTNLANWQSIWTSTLSTLSTNFVDPDWVNHPQRFYRLRSN